MLAHVVNIPPAQHLAEDFARIADLPRNEAIAALRELRSREFSRISAWQQSHLGELTGQDVCTSLTALTDGMVINLAQRAAAKVNAPADWSNHVGVLAVGGYGRGEMNPFSDLDLLVLGAGKQPAPWQGAFYNELQTMCWDVKFTVGASQRGLPELARIIDEDFVTATAVIEWRPLLAGTAIQAQIEETLKRFRDKRATPFLQYKLQELSERRAKAGASLFLICLLYTSDAADDM
jgi:[protein-PII] uridylyltransferase